MNVCTLENRGRNMLLDKESVSSLLAGIVSIDCRLTGMLLSFSNFARKWNFLEKMNSYMTTTA